MARRRRNDQRFTPQMDSLRPSERAQSFPQINAAMTQGQMQGRPAQTMPPPYRPPQDTTPELPRPTVPAVQHAEGFYAGDNGFQGIGSQHGRGMEMDFGTLLAEYNARLAAGRSGENFLANHPAFATNLQAGRQPGPNGGPQQPPPMNVVPGPGGLPPGYGPQQPPPMNVVPGPGGLPPGYGPQPDPGFRHPTPGYEPVQGPYPDLSQPLQPGWGAGAQQPLVPGQPPSVQYGQWPAQPTPMPPTNPNAPGFMGGQNQGYGYDTLLNEYNQRLQSGNSGENFLANHPKFAQNFQQGQQPVYPSGGGQDFQLAPATGATDAAAPQAQALATAGVDPVARGRSAEPAPATLGLPLSPEFEAGRRGLEDQLAGTLANLGVAREDLAGTVQLITARLATDLAEEKRQIDESANARGIYNSGIRTSDRNKAQFRTDRRVQDVGLEAARALREMAASESGARSQYFMGLAELLSSVAAGQATDPTTPISVDTKPDKPGRPKPRGPRRRPPRKRKKN